MPILFKKFLDDGILGRNLEATYYYISIMLGAILLKQCFGNLQRILLVNVGENLTQLLRRKISFAVTRKPLVDMQQKEAGDVIARTVTETTTISAFYTSVIPTFFSNVTLIFMGVILLCRIDIKRTLLFLVFAPLIVMVTRYYSAKLQAVSKVITEKTAGLNSIVEQLVHNLLLLKQTRAYAYGDDRFKSQCVDIRTSVYKHTRYNIFFYVIIALIFIASYNIGLLWCGSEVVAGVMSVGTLLAVTDYMYMLLDPLAYFAQATTEYQRNIVFVDRFEDLVSDIGDTKEDAETLLLPSKEVKSLSFNNVSFSYGEKEIFKNLSFELMAGEKLQIKGKNGSGKSTLINLLTGVLTPQGGEILLNDKKVENIAIEQYIAVVPQNSCFFDDSIENNILMDRAQPKESILSLGDELGIKEELQGENLNLQKALVAKAGNISGGQAQKLNLLRTLLTDTPIVVFDEVDTYLDVSTKQAVYSYVHNHLEKTYIFISHEPIEGMHMDKIVQL